MPASRAFSPDEYVETRTPAQLRRERAEVERQVANLLRMAQDEKYRKDAVDRLQERRRPVAASLQIEEVEREGKVRLLVAAHSVVARVAELDENARHELQDRFGIAPPDDTHRVAQLAVPPDRIGAGGITKLITSIRDHGARVEPNHVVPLAGVMKGAGGPEPSAGARPYPAVEYTRRKAPAPIVAVLDTGISTEDRADGYLAMPVDPADVDLLDAFPPDDFLDAGAGHGAFVTGVLQQVAPGTTVHVHRVLDSDGITSEVEVAERIRQAVDKGAQILNLSLGTETVGDRPPAALQDVIEDLGRSHPEVLIVCAAGNGADTERIWPAAFAPDHDNVVAVAALDPAGNGAAWSTHGDWVTCSAIGEGVVSTYVEGTEDGDLIGDPDPDTYGPGSWATWTGTSFATPQITGALVRICVETGTSPREALADLLARGTAIEGYGQALRILPGTCGCS